MKNAVRHYCNPRCMAVHRRTRPQAVPYHATWVDHARLTAEVVVDTAVLLVLLFGLPVLLWMVLT